MPHDIAPPDSTIESRYRLNERTPTLTTSPEMAASTPVAHSPDRAAALRARIKKSKSFPKMLHFLNSAATFISVISPILTIVGAAGLAVISIDDVRQQARVWFAPSVWEWGAENKVAVVVALSLLASLPPLLSKWIVRRQALRRETRRNVELTTAAGSQSSRVAHLITKIGDVRNGEIDGKYIGYTLMEACNYFKTRAVHTSGAGAGDRIEAYLMRSNRNGRGTIYFERYRQTHTPASDFGYNLSGHQNRVATETISELLSGSGYVFTANEADLERVQDAFKIPKESSPYRQYLAVPVRKDRKITDPKDVWGLLFLMSTAPGMLRETDEALLTTYSWYISAALALDVRGSSSTPAPLLGVDFPDPQDRSSSS